MIRVNILYPAGHRFDFKYYLERHMPMAIEKLGAALKGVSVERGVSGARPEDKPAYIAQCHLLFESADAFYAAFMPVAGALQGDIPNYTDATPVIQISNVEMVR